MTRLSRWFRTIAPPWFAWAIYLACLWLMTGSLVFDRPSRKEFALCLLVVGSGPLAYAAYRVIYFHPANWDRYRTWLEATPWHYPKPLPFGQVILQWQDLALLAMLAGICVAFDLIGFTLPALPSGRSQWLAYVWHIVPIIVYTVVIPFFGAYAICVAMTILGTGQFLIAATIYAGIGLLVRVIADPWLALFAVLLTYGIAHWGVQRSLASYPWSKEELAHGTFIQQRARQQQQPVFGWPYSELGPEPSIRGMDSRLLSHGPILTGLIGGWWIYALLAHFEYVWEFEGTEEVLNTFWLVCRCAIGLLAGLRLLIYCVGHWPPISLAGRIATGQWIIPGYDQMIVAPLITVVAGLTMEILFRRYNVSTQYAIPLVLTTTWCLVWSIGPSYKAWHLTGSHRLRW